MKFVAALKLPAPSPNKIDTLSESLLATARSCLPSPLKSPTATELRISANSEICGSAEIARAIAQQDRHVAWVESVGNGEVLLAIAIEIAHRY